MADDLRQRIAADYPSRRRIPGSARVHATRSISDDGRTSYQVTACGRRNTGAALGNQAPVTCPACLAAVSAPTD